MERKFTQQDVDKAYDTGLKNGHYNPNKETKNFMEESRRVMNNLENTIIKNQQKMEDLISQNTKEHEELKNLITESLKGKANKWVEKVMIGTGATFGIGFMSLLGWLIIEGIKRFG